MLINKERGEVEKAKGKQEQRVGWTDLEELCEITCRFWTLTLLSVLPLLWVLLLVLLYPIPVGPRITWRLPETPFTSIPNSYFQMSLQQSENPEKPQWKKKIKENETIVSKRQKRRWIP